MPVKSRLVASLVLVYSGLYKAAGDVAPTMNI